ncbi:MAG: sugar phosphate isomerase/epimerase family protein [Planctomycetota bacterium]
MSARRLGFSFLYFTPRVGDAHLPWLGRLRAHGYDGAELPVVDATDAELAAMRRALDAEGLAATAVGFAVADANPLDPDPAARRKAVAHLARLAEKSAALGAGVLAGPVHSAYGRFTEAPPTGDERKWCADVLREAGARAAAYGVTLAVEPLNRFECYFLNTAADCAALVREVGHPNVVGALDTHHAHLEEDDLPGAIRAMGAAGAQTGAGAGTLGHVQLSENHRGTPGRGQVDFPAVLGALDELGYEGWLVVEAFSRQDPAFGSALRIWRALDAGPEEVLAAGAALARAAR